MNKKQILEGIYQNFRGRTGYGIVVGVEQEFYISGQWSVGGGQEEKVDNCIAALNEMLSGLPFFSEIEKERGENQFEVQVYPTDNPSVMADVVDRLRNIIKENLEPGTWNLEIPNSKFQVPSSASFAAKPFPDQPGSALHININLIDSSGRNLFMKEGEEESAVFGQCIAGLLELMPASMKYFAPYEEAYIRYTDHGMESPSTISWGGDNRTVSLRVPSVPTLAHTRRIEHRLSCADADPYLVMAAIIAGLEYGVVNKLENKHPRIYGNAFLPQYNLQKLPQSLEEAVAIKNEYLEGVMGSFA